MTKSYAISIFSLATQLGHDRIKAAHMGGGNGQR